MRFLMLLVIVGLSGCATPRVYDSEPVNKDAAALISAAGVKALIRPHGADRSV